MATRCSFRFTCDRPETPRTEATLTFDEWDEMYRTGKYKGRTIFNLVVDDWSVDFAPEEGQKVETKVPI